MYYHVLACDYDGTIAEHGKVDAITLAALKKVKGTGRRLLLVTGRELASLKEAFPGLDVFDQVIAENGALLYTPSTRAEKVLAEAPPDEFVQMLKLRGVTPLSVGRAIVATWVPNETTVLEVIHELGLELQVIFNKGAVMVLPPGVNKATGLTAALVEMKLSPHNTVGVGDAENDHAFLTLCECSVAVANALPALKERADFVTPGDHGSGVVELVDMLIRNDLEEVAARLTRHDILLGTEDTGNEVRLRPHSGSVLVAGTSGGGKSTLTTGMLERFIDKDYQICIIDPEGDYEHFEQAAVLGTSDNSPAAAEVLEVLDDPRHNATVNLLALDVHERPKFIAELLPQLLRLRSSTGRPHWIVIDETHHLFPRAWSPTRTIMPDDLYGYVLITVHPDHVAVPLLKTVKTIIAIGADPEGTIRSFSESIGRPSPGSAGGSLEPGEAVLWRVDSGASPIRFRSILPDQQLRRHVRKYAAGKLGKDKSFYFRGPDNRLHLRAHNLASFVEIGKGLDDETWLYHLQNRDYSRWIAMSIKDEELASEVAAVEQTPRITAKESRIGIKRAIDRRYTLPA
jgi:HAD superfamily hydrolase (TIGR01484 family)